MRRIVTTVCCVFVAGSVIRSQAQQPAPPPFKGGVSLITVDVTVLNRDGAPVPGLTASDFQVKLNGRVQPIRALTYLEASTEVPESAAGPKRPVMPQLWEPAEVPASATASAVEPRVFVILVDDLSYLPLAGKSLFTAAQRFVAGLPASDLVGFATSSGPGAVNPTRDRAPITAALGAVVGEFNDPRAIDRGGPSGGKFAGPDHGLGIKQALDIDRGDKTALIEAIVRECFNGDRSVVNTQSLEGLLIANRCASDLQTQARRTAALTRQTIERQVGAFQSVISAMKPATGIKHLVVLTEGVGVTIDASTLEPVARAAADAGIQLSVMVDEPGLNLSDKGRRDPGVAVAAQADTGMSQRRREDDAMFVNGAHTLADMVGGAFYRVVGSPDPFFQRVVVASSALYRIAVEAPANTAPGRDFALVATVRRPGLTTQTNKRAMATAPAAAGTSPSTAAPAGSPPKAAVSIDDQLRAAMTAGRTFDGIPIGLVSAVRRASDPAQMEIGIRVRIPATARGPLTAVFGVVDEAGKLRSGRRPIDAPADGDSYELAFSVPVTPGAYRLRFAVADASGRIGAIEKPVRAQLAPMGPFEAADLQMSWTDAADQEQTQFPAPENMPANATTLVASLELYQVAGAAAPRDVIVKLGIGAVGQGTAIERIVVPVNENGTWRAAGQFPLERFAAGAYTVQATVLVDGKVVGTNSARIKK